MSTPPASPGARPACGPRVVVVGAGVIGAVSAWRLAQRGARVTLITGPFLAYAASHASAGMLAPVTEATYTDTALLPLNLASLRRWPEFAAELESATGEEAGLRTDPTLSVAATPDDAAHLREFADFLDRSGLTAEPLTGRELRRAEPLLAPSVRSGLRVVDDFSCDNRLLWNALLTACRGAGVEINPGEVQRYRMCSDAVRGVVLAGGAEIPADTVVLAAGAWAGEIPAPIDIPVRPVKGQSLRLHAGAYAQLGSVVRAFHQGFEVYLVPRTHGEVVVGATVEERGFDARVTGDGAYGLLRDARAIVPMTAEYEVMEFSVGWRPGTPDNAPLLGPSGVDGLVLACGHYRNGILLTPITGDIVADAVLDGALPELARPHTIDRFATPSGRTQ